MTEQLSKLGPTLALLVVLVLAAFLGYIFGVTGVQVVDTGLWQLDVSYQGIYVQAVADGYALDHNDSLADERLSFLCQQDGGLVAAVNEAASRYGSDAQKKANLDQLGTLISSGQVQQNTAVAVCNHKPINSFASTANLLSIVVLMLMFVVIVATGVLRVMRHEEEAPMAVASAGAAAAAMPPAGASVAPRPGPASTAAETAPVPATSAPASATVQPAARSRATLPSLPGFGRRKTKEEEAAEARSAAQAGARISAETEKTDYEAMGQEPPIVQFMTTYLHGDDLYDDSFSIETSSGEFLGETGVGISETINNGDAKNVTALEVWLFDKNDIRTVTKVVMSDQAYNDDAIRAKLAPKGEAVLAHGGDRIRLETATLRVQARVVDLSYKTGPFPPNSVIDRITIELAAWKGQGGAAARPATSSMGGGLPSAPGGGGTPPTGFPPMSGS